MSWLSRTFLLISALCFGLFVIHLLVMPVSYQELQREAAPVTAMSLAVGVLVSLPLWLPAIIPNRFQLLSKMVRWIGALVLLFPLTLFVRALAKHAIHWLKKWETYLTSFAQGLLGVTCCVVAMAILVWPEVRRRLGKPTDSAADHQIIGRKPFWQKAFLGLTVSLCGIMLIGSIGTGHSIYDVTTGSYVWIRNYSGSDVRFEKVTVDGERIWGKPDIVIKTIKNLEKPWLDTRGDSIKPRFRASKGNVELKLVTVNEKQERETVSCTLDNRRRPASFEAFYYKGRLACRDCRDAHQEEGTGPDVEPHNRVNWPPEWPKGPYPQPIE